MNLDHNRNPSKYCTTIDDVPNDSHWAIILNDSVFIPGDERSRTNPGHGYPESNMSYLTYIAFVNEQEWITKIKELTKNGTKNFKAMKVVPATITTDVSVTVS